jgi:hypothetical protein
LDMTLTQRQPKQNRQIGLNWTKIFPQNKEIINSVKRKP